MRVRVIILVLIFALVAMYSDWRSVGAQDCVVCAAIGCPEPPPVCTGEWLLRFPMVMG